MTELPEPYRSDQIQLFALCIWREARGEPYAAKRGIAWVIRNRCLLAPLEGFHKDISSNILKRWAFSSFNEGDVNSTKYPKATDPSWIDSLKAARDVTADPTKGACFYYSRPLMTPPSAWGKVEHSAAIGGLQFYRIPDSFPKWSPPPEMASG